MTHKTDRLTPAGEIEHLRRYLALWANVSAAQRDAIAELEATVARLEADYAALLARWRDEQQQRLRLEAELWGDE